MPTLKATQPIYHRRRSYQIGDVFEADSESAQEIVAAGLAEEVQTQQPAAKPAKSREPEHASPPKESKEPAAAGKSAHVEAPLLRVKPDEAAKAKE